MSELTEIFGEPIYTYTRAQAIEDGVLVDVSAEARDAGFKFPVAITAELCAVIENAPKGQDVTGRLWNVLWMGSLVAQRGGEVIHYQLILSNGRKKNATLKMMCHGGDEGEPVITIMMPWED